MLALSDFDADGALDIATAAFTGNTVDVLLSNTTTSATLENFSLKTRSKALEALTLMTTSRNKLAIARGRIGGDMSRLSAAYSNVVTTKENLEGARSQIMDVDVAEETARLVRERIRQQASAAILAQASQQPAIALALLKN